VTAYRQLSWCAKFKCALCETLAASNTYTSCAVDLPLPDYGRDVSFPLVVGANCRTFKEAMDISVSLINHRCTQRKNDETLRTVISEESDQNKDEFFGGKLVVSSPIALLWEGSPNGVLQRSVGCCVCDSSSRASTWRIELGLTQEIITETHPATTRRRDGFRNPGLEPARPSLGPRTSDQLGLGLYLLLLGGKFL